MSKKMIMGNEAIALGAICAGVNVISGYPGTPSSEIIEFAAKYIKQTGAYIEWSVNEKAALEVAAGASYCGARTLVTMKQVGLNVAGDPAMCLSYVGVKGGMVIVSADDPGPISSQTEQDTRMYGAFSKIPVFDPSSPEEAFEMIQQAFKFSERYNTPVLLRPTTRIDHGYASMEIPELPKAKKIEGFEKDTGGVSYCYAKEALEILGEKNIPVLKIGTPYPFPSELAKSFLADAEEVLVIEELDPVIENELLKLCGKNHLENKIHGKLTKEIPEAGEYSVEIVKQALAKFIGLEVSENKIELPPLPVRPPVLCAGCPHRASFYAVKQAMKGEKTVYCGDIGCYTLGNAKPLDMCDTCLCMGADITMAQGFFHAENDRHCFSFIGDSTFFASGITGVVNAVYNQARQTICILDNSTTAMTGHQPHPGTGVTMMGEITEKISIEKILKAVGVEPVVTVNPFNLEESIAAVKECDSHEGVSAVIFKSPCIALLRKEEFKEFRKPALCVENEKCVGCKKCINEIGCPALGMNGKKARIDSSLCTGCSLCPQICPVNAIASKN